MLAKCNFYSTVYIMEMRLTLLILLAFLGHIQTQTTEEVLSKLNRELDIRTILIFGGNTTSEIWPKAENFDFLPQLVITHENVTDLRESQGERVISLIFVDYINETYLEDIVKPTLLNLHLQDIVFLTNSTLLTTEPWEWLFLWCWSQGFWHVLLMNAANQYLTMMVLPVMSILKVNLPDYFKIRHQRHSNLLGYAVRVTVGNNPPRVHAYYNSEGVLQIGGFYGNIVKMFVGQYNATLDYAIMPDMEQYSVLSCIEYILEHRADICTDAILFGGGIEITRPMQIVNGRLMVPFDTPLENYKYFRMPFTSLVWFVIFISFVCSTILLILVEYIEYQRLEVLKNIFNIFESFICSSINLKHLPPKYRYGLEALLIFSGFFLSNIYLGYLSSILLTKIYRRDIDSIRDVAEHNLTILTTDFHQFILETSHASPLVRQQTKLVTEDFLIENLRNLNPEYVFFDLDSRFDYYMYQQIYMSRPRMKKLMNEVVTTDIGEIPMRSYWPFQDILKDFMENIFCHGIFKKLTTDMHMEGIRLGELKFISTKGLSVEPLSLEYFVLCGLILLGGYSMSILCFVMEIIACEKMKRK